MDGCTDSMLAIALVYCGAVTLKAKGSADLSPLLKTKSSNPTLKYLRKNEERDQQNEGKKQTPNN